MHSVTVTKAPTRNAELTQQGSHLRGFYLTSMMPILAVIPMAIPFELDGCQIFGPDPKHENNQIRLSLSAV